MNDMGDPELLGNDADQFIARIDSIRKRRRDNTETLRMAWTEGRLTKSDLPCYDLCDGTILVNVEGESITGQCPMYMQEGVCPLVERHEKEIVLRLTRAGFGPQYHHPDPTRLRALQACQEFLAHLRQNLSTGRGLILSGGVGVGKTMTAAYLARQMLEERVGVWKIHMPEFIEALADPQTRKATVERAIKVQVLIIDDFGSGDIPGWIMGIVERIVEHRYGNQRSVIVTTNLDRQTLVHAPEFRRMVDRWREKNRFVSVGGESQRHGAEQG